MSTRERVVLTHYYQNAIAATTLRYPDEVTEPSRFAELKDLPEPDKEELVLMNKVVDKMTKDLGPRLYHDGYNERIEAIIASKMKGEVAQVKEGKPKISAKRIMEMLRETTESLNDLAAVISLCYFRFKIP